MKLHIIYHFYIMLQSQLVVCASTGGLQAHFMERRWEKRERVLALPRSSVKWVSRGVRSGMFSK